VNEPAKDDERLAKHVNLAEELMSTGMPAKKSTDISAMGPDPTNPLGASCASTNPPVAGLRFVTVINRKYQGRTA